MKKISKDKKRPLFGILDLEIGIYLGFGFWDLGIPARARDLEFRR
jgi:hypothetical protein